MRRAPELARERSLALIGTLGCVLAVAVAFGSERLLGMVPCAFCLLERKPYYVGIGLGLVALSLPKRLARLMLWGLAAVVLAGAALSFVHVGVEQHWWPDPLPECTVPDLRGLTPAQRLAAMPARAAKPCEDPDFLIPGLPISMTQMSFAYGLAFSAGLAMSLAYTKGRKFR